MSFLVLYNSQMTVFYQLINKRFIKILIKFTIHLIDLYIIEFKEGISLYVLVLYLLYFLVLLFLIYYSSLIGFDM